MKLEEGKFIQPTKTKSPTPATDTTAKETEDNKEAGAGADQVNATTVNKPSTRVDITDSSQSMYVSTNHKLFSHSILKKLDNLQGIEAVLKSQLHFQAHNPIIRYKSLSLCKIYVHRKILGLNVCFHLLGNSNVPSCQQHVRN